MSPLQEPPKANWFTRYKFLIGFTLVIFFISVISSFAQNSQQTVVKGVSSTNPPTATATLTPTLTLAPSPTPTTSISPTQSTTQDHGLSNDNYYTNSSGNEVHSPAYSTDNSVPAGATAKCVDGTYSFSQHRSGTCSHHGGVAQWL